MKKITFLFAVLLASVFSVENLSAQAVDVTPPNWKFDNMKIGGAEHLFIKEGARTGGNLKYAYRLADGKGGAITMNWWNTDNDVWKNDVVYQEMSDEVKQIFQDFYNACQIVDAGAMGKIFMYQGKNSTAVDSRAVKNAQATGGAPGLNVMTSDDLVVPGFYRMTITARIIANEGSDAGKFDIYVGTSWWDGIDGDYRSFSMNYAPAYNNYWISYTFDYEIKANSDSDYKALPINTKIGMTNPDGLLVMFDDFKLEKIQAIDPENKPMKMTVRTDLNDTPTSVKQVKGSTITVWSNNKLINVLDAKTNIEVYNLTGQLVVNKTPESTLTTLTVETPGVYLVKQAGEAAQKVIIK